MKDAVEVVAKVGLMVVEAAELTASMVETMVAYLAALWARRLVVESVEV